MEKKSKIVIGLFLALVAAVSVWKYQVFFVERDFYIYDYVECDPSVEPCFVSDCDESDPECDLAPYKKVERLARGAAICEDPGFGCVTGACSTDEQDCLETLCSDATLEEGEICLQIETNLESGSQIEENNAADAAKTDIVE